MSIFSTRCIIPIITSRKRLTLEHPLTGDDIVLSFCYANRCFTSNPGAEHIKQSLLLNSPVQIGVWEPLHSNKILSQIRYDHIYYLGCRYLQQVFDMFYHVFDMFYHVFDIFYHVFDTSYHVFDRWTVVFNYYCYSFR